MVRLLFIAALWVALTGPAQAFTGQFIRDACLSADETQVAMCVGYTTGIGQTLILANRWAADSMLFHFCAPHDFQPQGTGALILEHLDRYPDEHKLDASALGLAAFQEAFPCADDARN
jgi:hypothetical protein